MAYPGESGPLIRTPNGAGPEHPATRSERPEQLGFLAALLALAAVVIFAVSIDLAAGKSALVMEQAHAASQATQDLITALLNAETGQRGFLLTNSQEFLDPYGNAVRTLPSILEQFRKATAAVPIDGPDIANILELSRLKLLELNRSLEMVKAQSRVASLQLVASGQGNRYMEQLRVAATVLERDYANHASQEADIMRRRHRTAVVVIGAGSILVALILAGALRRLRGTQMAQATLLAELSAKRKQYQLLADRLQLVREEERRHLAREIHDVLGQALTSIKLDIAAACQRIEKNAAGTAIEKLNEGMTSVDETIRMLRKIASELRPPLLDHVGLAAAVKAHMQDFSARTGIVCHFEGEDGRLPLADNERIAIYRIFQESLTNIARHADTQEAWVGISLSRDAIKLRVEDRGKGFDTVKNAASLGLLGMRERARLIGADLRIDSEIGQGSIVELSLARGSA